MENISSFIVGIEYFKKLLYSQLPLGVVTPVHLNSSLLSNHCSQAFIDYLLCARHNSELQLAAVEVFALKKAAVVVYFPSVYKALGYIPNTAPPPHTHKRKKASCSSVEIVKHIWKD